MRALFRITFGLLALCALSAFTVGEAHGHERPLDPDPLTLSIDWYEGVTGHSDDGVCSAAANAQARAQNGLASSARAAAMVAVGAGCAYALYEATGDAGGAVTAAFTLVGLALPAPREKEPADQGADPAPVSIEQVAETVEKIAARQKEAADRYAELEREVEAGTRSRDELKAEMDKRLSELVGSIEGVQRAVAEAAQDADRPAIVGANGRPLSAQDTKERDAFHRYARNGPESRQFTGDDYETLTTGMAAARELSTDDLTTGGVFVPANTTNRIIERVYELSPIRQNATVESITQGDRLPIPKESDKDYDSGWVGERQDREQTETEAFGLVDIPVHEQYAEPRMTNKMLEDSGIDIEGRLVRGIGRRFALTEGISFVTGDGVNKPLGLLSAKTLAALDALNALFKSGHATNAPDWKVLAKVMTALPTSYQAMARWFWHRTTTYVALTYLDGENRPLWNFQALKEGGHAEFLGHPVVHVDAMPAFDLATEQYTTGDVPILFGDMEEAYTVVDRRGMVVLRDNLTKKGFTKFYTTRRVGGQTVQPNALRGIRAGA